MTLKKLIRKTIKKIDYLYVKMMSRLFVFLADYVLNRLQKIKTQVAKYPSLCKAKLDKKALNWHKFNPWFGKDDFLTEKALNIHEMIVSSGIRATSLRYYHKIDKLMYLHFKNELKKYYSMEN